MKEDIITIFEKHYNKNHVLLDVGCGIGIFTKKNILNFKKIYAIDINPNRIEILNSFRKKNGINNLQVDQMDIGNLKYPNSYFDIISFSRSFSHIDGINNALSETFRVLKSNGVIYISETHLENPSIAIKNSMILRDLIDDLIEFNNNGDGMCDLHTMTLNEVKNLLIKYNFEIIKSKIQRYDEDVSDKYLIRLKKDIESQLQIVFKNDKSKYNFFFDIYRKCEDSMKKSGFELPPYYEITGIKQG